MAGAAVQWLRDGLGLIERAAESEALARSVDDTGGVYLVPGLRRPRARPTGTSARAGRWSGSRAGRRARTSCAPRSRRSPTRRATWSSASGEDSGLALDDAARGRRRLRERLPDAVPGRPARRAGGAPGGPRGDGQGRGAARRAGRRLLDRRAASWKRRRPEAAASSRACRPSGARRSTRAGSGRSSGRAAGRGGVSGRRARS